MNKRQEAKLNMYQVVINVCNHYLDAYAKSPAFGSCTGELTALVSAIRQAQPQQSIAPVKGATDEKSVAEDRLVQACLKVSYPLNVYALKAGNTTLMQQTNINKHTLYNTFDSNTLSIAKTIAAEATVHAADLAYYGLDANDLTELNAAVAAFEGLIGNPRTAIVERKQYTGNLAQLFAAADSLLFDQMDKLIVPFKVSAPAFYTDYHNARNIINTATRHRKDNGNNDNANSDNGKQA